MLQLKMSVTPPKKPPGKNLMTDSYLGGGSDEELDAELRENESLDRTLSEIIEGVTPNSSLCQGDNSSDKGPSSELSDLSRMCQELSDNCRSQRETVSSITSHRVESDSVISPRLKNDNVDSSSNSSDLDNSRRGGGDSLGGRASKNQTEVSINAAGATTLSTCDDSADTKDQGKTCLQTEPSYSDSATKNVCKGVSPSPSRKLELDEDLNPDIRSPGQKFPESWELYEEVLMVDKKRGVEILYRNSSERESSPKFNFAPRSNVACNGSKGVTNPLELDKGSALAQSTKVTASCFASKPKQKNSIPDVEVIYEHSPDVLTNINGSRERVNASSLKESTV